MLSAPLEEALSLKEDKCMHPQLKLLGKEGRWEKAECYSTGKHQDEQRDVRILHMLRRMCITASGSPLKVTLFA